MCYSLVSVSKSSKTGKKMMAVFEHCDTNRTKTTHFGAEGMSDFTIHKDTERKKRYLARHKANENWDDYTSAGSLSRWILWNKPSLKESIAHYKQKFFRS